MSNFYPPKTIIVDFMPTDDSIDPNRYWLSRTMNTILNSGIAGGMTRVSSNFDATAKFYPTSYAQEEFILDTLDNVNSNNPANNDTLATYTFQTDQKYLDYLQDSVVGWAKSDIVGEGDISDRPETDSPIPDIGPITDPRVEPGPIIPITPEPIIPITPEPIMPIVPEPITPIVPEPEPIIPFSRLPQYNPDQRLIVEIAFVSTPFVSAEQSHNIFWGMDGDAFYDTFTFWGHPGELNFLENDNPDRWVLKLMVMPEFIQGVYDFVKMRSESLEMTGVKVYMRVSPTPPRNIVSQAGKRCTQAVGIVNDPITGYPRPYRDGCDRDKILAETDLPEQAWASDVFMNVLYIDPKGFFISGNEYMSPTINSNPTLITIEITPKDQTKSSSPRTFQTVVLRNEFPEIYSQWNKLPIKKVGLNRFNNRTQIYRMDFSPDVESLVYTVEQMINEAPSMPYTAEVTYL